MENFKEVSQEEAKKIYEKYPQRKEVDDLKKMDDPYKNSVEELAMDQNKFFDELKFEGLNAKAINRLADLYGDEVLSKMKNQSEKFIDELTRIGNRKFLEEIVPKFLNQEKRKEGNATVLMLDIDHFKAVNDTHGHQAGDEALQKIAQIIKQSVRNSDFVFRYGGEEFTVFLPDTDISQARIVAEKIRKNIEEAKIEISDKENTIKPKKINKTISIGCMSTSQLDNWKEDSRQHNMQEYMDNLIRKADRALYFSKENGRNQVNIYSPELENREKQRENN